MRNNIHRRRESRLGRQIRSDPIGKSSTVGIFVRDDATQGCTLHVGEWQHLKLLGSMLDGVVSGEVVGVAGSLDERGTAMTVTHVFTPGGSVRVPPIPLPAHIILVCPAPNTDWGRLVPTRGCERVIVCGGWRRQVELVARLADAFFHSTTLTRENERVSVPVTVLARQDDTGVCGTGFPVPPPEKHRFQGHPNVELKGNPFTLTHDHCMEIAGSGGEPVDSILEHTPGIQTPMQALERCVDASHLAPTSPSHLKSSSGRTQRTMCLPPSGVHLLVAGNQPSFQAKTHKRTGTLMVCVPRGGVVRVVLSSMQAFCQ